MSLEKLPKSISLSDTPTPYLIADNTVLLFYHVSASKPSSRLTFVKFY
jgi:hypothetical protein